MRILIIGNGDGIGLALTKRLLNNGKSVVGVSRRELDPLAERHIQHVLDVLTPKFPESIAAVVAESLPIDTLVYCAGIGELYQTSGVDRDGDTIRVNLAALADTVAAVLPGMRAQGFGRIIGISSIGDRASPDAPSYGASKAGMTAYLLGLRRPLGRFGIRVSAVRFGFVDTKMAKGPRLWVAPPAKAARQIHNAISRKRWRVYITRRWWIIAKLFQWIPSWLYHRIG